MENMLKGEFKKINEYIYTLKYENDYGLDEFLEHGAKNVGELIKYVQNYFKLQKGEVNIGGSGFACTTFNAETPEGQHIMARNFDYKDAPCIIVHTSPKNGYKSVAVTDTNVLLYGEKHQNLSKVKNRNRLLAAPYTCMDGVNEKGLAIAVLEIKAKATKQETGKTPITTTAMIRAVLDKCATVEEAIELFNKYDMHDSLFCNYHYQITDITGKSVIIEYVDNKMKLVWPKDKFQYCMNFFHSEGGDNSKGFGYTRQIWVEDAFKECDGIMTEDDAMNLLDKCQLVYKHKRGYMITSLWSAVYNNNEKSMLLCARMEFDKRFKFTVENWY